MLTPNDASTHSRQSTWIQMPYYGAAIAKDNIVYSASRHGNFKYLRCNNPKLEASFAIVA